MLRPTTLMLLLIGLIVSISATTCPDGGSCPDPGTCCMVQSGGYGCCPFANATCCPNKSSCCGAHMTCDDANHMCKPSSARHRAEFMTSLIQAKKSL